MRITRSNSFCDQSQTELVSNLRSNSVRSAERITDQTIPCRGAVLVESNCTCEEMSKSAFQKNIWVFLEEEIDRRIDAKVESGMLKVNRKNKSKRSAKSANLHKM